jgi:hypothetical protein
MGRPTSSSTAPRRAAQDNRPAVTRLLPGGPAGLPHYLSNLSHGWGRIKTLDRTAGRRSCSRQSRTADEAFGLLRAKVERFWGCARRPAIGGSSVSCRRCRARATDGSVRRLLTASTAPDSDQLSPLPLSSVTACSSSADESSRAGGICLRGLTPRSRSISAWRMALPLPR